MLDAVQDTTASPSLLRQARHHVAPIIIVLVINYSHTNIMLCLLVNHLPFDTACLVTEYHDTIPVNSYIFCVVLSKFDDFQVLQCKLKILCFSKILFIMLFWSMLLLWCSCLENVKAVMRKVVLTQ